MSLGLPDFFDLERCVRSGRTKATLQKRIAPESGQFSAQALPIASKNLHSQKRGSILGITPTEKPRETQIPETIMTTIAKFLKNDENFLARGVAYWLSQSRLAIRQHLALCQVVADAIAHNQKR